MTHIIIVKKSNQYKGFECLGHAGFRRRNDVVCAAISMLVINTINSIEQFCDDRFRGEADEKKGQISFYFYDEPSEGAVLLMDSMILGLTKTVENYGEKYLKLEYKEV